MNRIFICWFLLVLSVSINSQQRNILTSDVTVNKLKEIVLSVESYRPYPEYSNRMYWEGLPDSVKTSFVEAGEELLEYGWPPLPATLLLDYIRTGNRHRFQVVADERRETLFMLMLAELAEGSGRFMDQIVNGVWSVCEESTWVYPAHISQGSAKSGLPDVTDPYVDLMSAEMATLVSLAFYFFGDRFDEISPQINKRIKHEVRRRVLIPAYENEFWWMGFDTAGRRPNNWNPWICSNWMLANFIIEDDLKVKTAYTYKILQVLDNFLNPYPSDGGCDEGPSYWNAAAGALFDNLVILNSATGNFFSYAYENPLIRAMGTYITKVHIGNGYFVNFADAGPKANPGWEILFQYGKKINDKGMMEFGGCRFKNEDFIPGTWHIHRFLESLALLDDAVAQPCNKPYPEYSWLSDIQLMTVRDDEGIKEGFFLAAKGGHNGESHNHNDVGSFMIYDNARPVLIDIGSGTYTKRTFSDERYKLWFNRSDYHNVPIINDHVQQAGKEYSATNVNSSNSKKKATFSAEIQEAYPEEAGILEWKRQIVFKKRRSIRFIEDYEFKHQDNKILFPLMTIMTPVPKAEQTVLLYGIEAQYIIEFSQKVIMKVEKIPLNLPEDEHVQKIWGDEIYRITIEPENVGQSGKITYTIKRM